MVDIMVRTDQFEEMEYLGSSYSLPRMFNSRSMLVEFLE